MRRCSGFSRVGAHPCCSRKITLIERKIPPLHDCTSPSPIFLRLVKVRWGGSGRFIWKELLSWTMIARWSELWVIRVCYSESKIMWEQAIVRSGEARSLQEKTRVGKSRLRRVSEFVRDSVIRVGTPCLHKRT